MRLKKPSEHGEYFHGDLLYLFHWTAAWIGLCGCRISFNIFIIHKQLTEESCNGSQSHKHISAESPRVGAIPASLDGVGHDVRMSGGPELQLDERDSGHLVLQSARTLTLKPEPLKVGGPFLKHACPPV